jgi:subtilisin family serine protease
MAGTRADTASTGSGDYQGMTATTIVIPAGQTNVTFPILVNGDKSFEPNEGFRVVLSSPEMATIGVDEARGWIFDDDAPYPLPSDPLMGYQWYLYPTVGINAFPVWTDYTGAGVKVAVFDQGIDPYHTDLATNLLLQAGRNASNLGTGGNPRLADDNHGTAVAGTIAAARNGSGIVGIAYEASLTSIYNTFSVAEIASAFNYARNFDIQC